MTCLSYMYLVRACIMIGVLVSCSLASRLEME
eukprot:COSAG05_NODE_15143_length_377_cov_0.910072_2_plen_31_part_01